MISRFMTCRCETFWTSTTGLAPLTVIVSVTVPTGSCASILAVNPVLS